MFSNPPYVTTAILSFTNAAQSFALATPNTGGMFRLVGVHLAPQVSAGAGVIFVVHFKDNVPNIMATLSCATGGNDGYFIPYPGIYTHDINGYPGSSPINAIYQASAAGPNNAIVTMFYLADQG